MTSRYDGRSEAPTITRRRHVLACSRCRARRVKCDRAQPACSNCVKVGALCQPVQQTGSLHASLPSRSGSREPGEQNRLSKLEEEVARLSREVDSRSPSREPSHSPSPVDVPESRIYARESGTVKGHGSTYLSPYSWAATADEVISVESVLGEDLAGHSPWRSRDVVNEAVIPVVDERLHEILLEHYHHRVDPIVRVLHWPTFLERCRIFHQGTPSQVQTPTGADYTGAYPPTQSIEAPQTTPFRTRSSVLSRSSTLQTNASIPAPLESTFITLLYTVYFASITSIINSPNPPDLGQNNNAIALWSTFRKEVSTRTSALDGRILHSESIEMLQAMVLHMSVELGTCEPELQSLQLGVAIRMAQSLGVHRGPLHFSLDSIAIETRRRIWAQICILDTRLAEQLCREPTIAPDSYDTILPLSISDQDLSEIDQRKEESVRDGTHSEVLQEIEQSQEQVSPFSPMTITLIEAELSRQLQYLLCSRYQPRDRQDSISSYVTKRMLNAGRADPAQCANELRNRYSLRYNCDRFESSDPLQYLASELCHINIMKARLISRMAQSRDAAGHPAAVSGQSDTISVFHDALHIATRCATLSHQYSATPYNWYTRRIREVYSCSFLAMVLASGQQLSHEDRNAAWAVLDQLFTVDALGQSMEPGVRESLLGKVLEKARIKRGLQPQPAISQSFREQGMQAATGGYPTHLVSHSSAAASTIPNLAHTSSFQSSGNIFEDWDALMQEPIWPGLPVTDSNYWSSSIPLATTHRISPRSQPRPYEHERSLQQHTLPSPRTFPASYTLQTQSHSPIPRIGLASQGFELGKPGTLPQWSQSPSQQNIQTYPRQDTQDVVLRTQQVTPSRTWPAQNAQLQVPHEQNRERSVSQPAYGSHSRTPSGSPLKRRSASNLNSKPEDIELGVQQRFP